MSNQDKRKRKNYEIKLQLPRNNQLATNQRFDIKRRTAGGSQV